MTSCAKPTPIVTTKPVPYPVVQYRDLDETKIDCIYPQLSREMTWGEVVITLSENLDKCVSSIELIIKTLNPDS